MTHVDTFVRKNILTFPTLFPNRTAVLHHALCVIGNGYKWSDKGRIIHDFHKPVPLWNKEQELAALAELEADLKTRFEDEDLRNMLMADFRKHFDASTLVVEEIDIRVHQRAPITNFYPQSHYALLMNIPDNVTKEWQETCDEMKELAKAAGWSF